jgi:hypothetical protein
LPIAEGGKRVCCFGELRGQLDRDEIPVVSGRKTLSLSGRQVFIFPFRKGRDLLAAGILPSWTAGMLSAAQLSVVPEVPHYPPNSKAFHSPDVL